MRLIIVKKKYIIKLFITLFCFIIITTFISGCDKEDEEDDEFINPLETSIGSQGGTAFSADGNAVLEIPAGALSSKVTIVVGESSVIPHGTVGKAYKFGPEGLKFNKPVDIRFQYDPEDIPAGAADYDLVLGKQSGERWSEVPNCNVDIANHKITALITGFSIYGIFWPEAPSSAAEYCNLINDQVCKVLDATREMNKGMLMVFRACEHDFTQEYDPSDENFSSQEIDLFLAGFERFGESVVPLEETLLKLEELENAVMGFCAPSRINQRHKTNDWVDDFNSVAHPLLGKLYEISGVKSLVDENMPLVPLMDRLSYMLKVKMLTYTGMVIDTMSIGNDNAYHCQRACQLNKLFGEKFGKYFYKPPTSEVCSQDKSKIRAEAFNILNQKMSSAKTFKKMSGLSREMAGCFPDWMKELKKYVPEAAADATTTGGKYYWDCVSKICLKSEILDKIDHLKLASKAFESLPPIQAPGKFPRVTPAHAVVFLVPHDLATHPILVQATVAQGSEMNITEPYTGTYSLYFYSKGNYPVIIDNVEISHGNQSIEIPDIQPLEGIANPLFSALTNSESRTDLDPPYLPPCPTCGGGKNYLITHEGRILNEDIIGIEEIWTSAEFTFEFENDEAIIEVPYIVHKTITPKEWDDGSIFVYSQSSFTLQGTARWHILRRIRDGQTCYTINSVSEQEEETKTYSISMRDPKGNVMLINPVAEISTWPAPLPTHTELGCGDLPHTWERHDGVPPMPLPEGVNYKTDITVTIEEIE
ncbi:hypothetical protein GF312_08455 [Candidatus Poribacteria bacterium]|nr:hypothetical protein [Candidatus Poribacteria bacterium]